MHLRDGHVGIPIRHGAFSRVGLLGHVPEAVRGRNLDGGVQSVLIDARKFFINSDKKPQLGLDVPTSPPIAAFTFTATAATITLDLINPVTADTGVWVQIHEVGTALEPQTVSSVIKHDDPPPANHSTTISVQLSPGNYRFLTSIGGYKPIVYGATI